jgi:FkbM family methyltransferase
VTQEYRVIQLLRLAFQSVELDRRILAARRLPLLWRLRFLASKYFTLLRLAAGRPVTFCVPPVRMTVGSISELGTLQSSIADVHDDIVMPELLGHAEPLVVDVGANVGQFCHAVKLFFPDARILCFEPDPDVFASLKRNTNDLPQVELFNLGLGDRTETRPFRRHRLSTMSTFDQEANDPEYASETLDLQLRRLDDVLGPEVAPDLVKIDVEGFERQAILGARTLLGRTTWLVLELSLDHHRPAESNLAVLRDLAAVSADARIVRFGRPLGPAVHPACQDVVIRLRAASSPDGSGGGLS